MSLENDPKQSWAEIHISGNPIEINKASKEELLRIPGIGPKRVELIANYRQKQRIKSESDLKNLGIPIEKVSEFLLLDGKQPFHQLQFVF